MNRLVGGLGIMAGIILLAVGIAWSLKGIPLDVELGAYADTVRITDSIYIAQTETVTVYRERSRAAKARSDSAKQVSDSLDARVAIFDDSTLTLADSAAPLIVVPPAIVLDLRALRSTVAKQAETIAADSAEKEKLYGLNETSQWRIATRDKLYRLSIAKANGPRWGIGFTLGYGCGVMQCGPTANVGVTYSAKLPNLKQLFFHMVK